MRGGIHSKIEGDMKEGAVSGNIDESDSLMPWETVRYDTIGRCLNCRGMGCKPR